MTRILVTLVVVLLAGSTLRAQTSTQQQQERPRPRPGTIIDSPSSGRITDAPVPQKPATGDLAGQTI